MGSRDRGEEEAFGERGVIPEGAVCLIWLNIADFRISVDGEGTSRLTIILAQLVDEGETLFSQRASHE